MWLVMSYRERVKKRKVFRREVRALFTANLEVDCESSNRDFPRLIRKKLVQSLQKRLHRVALEKGSF